MWANPRARERMEIKWRMWLAGELTERIPLAGQLRLSWMPVDILEALSSGARRAEPASRPRYVDLGDIVSRGDTVSTQQAGHSESLRQFDEIFSRAEIRDSVKTIRYDVVLPIVSDKRLQNKFQSKKEAAENSHVFTEAILALFTPCQRTQDSSQHNHDSQMTTIKPRT
ncbi:hypothetical protein FDECE_7805 [Fusarium decemcellulare]|nr:hypothetical protein FDECE_7805 [Fusarium decemcellulare]